jgi:hypothetical protein
MRTLLAFATAVLLFAPGCGDDTTSSPDMAMSIKDMTMTAPGDMSPLSCAGILACATGCLQNTNPVTCTAACNAAGSTSGKQYFGQLEACILGVCAPDGGAPTPSCVMTAAGGTCAPQAGTCAQH